jgi:D-alanine--D-alanine ligase
MRIGLICGGPSAERGISLNSARSAMDHLTPLGWEIVPFYCDPKRNFYRLSSSQIYSNTPSDFDFKLATTAESLTLEELIRELKTDTDIVLPVIHGIFGEDGDLQEILESNNIPFVGSSSQSCRKIFDKDNSARYLAESGFPTLPNCCIHENDPHANRLQKIKKFFDEHHPNKVIVKPTDGGSSIGVSIATTPEDVLFGIDEIFTERYGRHALIEPFCKGQEFTIIVIQNGRNPVALIPTEIQLKMEEAEINEGAVLTYRSKYLPSNNVEYHCPPRFGDDVVARIQNTAEKIFTLFEMRDFARLDGWVLDDGSLYFSDFNPISGMEQNSFLFIQGSRIGMTHGEILQTIITHAAQRYGIDSSVIPVVKNPWIQKIRVIFGGETAERQVSLMSGTNVWLKLMQSREYSPAPYILAPKHVVWELPYSFALNHTTEEILTHCAEAEDIIIKLRILVPRIREKLLLPPMPANGFVFPRKMSLDQFCKEASGEKAFVFIALHGGEGEDGRIQAILNRHGLAYNGSDEEASHLCMDKFETGNVLRRLNDPLLTAAEKKLISSSPGKKTDVIWKESVADLRTNDILIKPQADGCSTGVVRIACAEELTGYLHAIHQGQKFLAAKTFSHQQGRIDLPEHADNFILEPFISTDKIIIQGLELVHKHLTDWIELTVGVLEEKGNYHALSPSITVAQGNVLSLEEKFQGGTGVNLTPPPETIISPKQIRLIKEKIEKAAQALGIQGYARIDIFFNSKSNITLVIEANSLPGLTPSTVIYHQALAEPIPMQPRELLEKLVMFGIERRRRMKNASPVNK